MIYITKQEGLYQNKVNSSLVSTCNCKMDYCSIRLIMNIRVNVAIDNGPHFLRQSILLERDLVP